MVEPALAQRSVPDQVLEWERRIQLHREMALALDPAVGNEEAAALACEVGRLKTREAEVRQARAQKHAELQRAVERREVVELRVRAAFPSPVQAYKKKQGIRTVRSMLSCSAS